MAKEFVITNLGESNYYLEMNMDYNRTKSICYLYQIKYIDQIIARSGLELLKSVKALIQIDLKLIKTKDQLVSKENIVRYCLLIGLINYLAIIIRFDILYTVSHLS